MGHINKAFKIINGQNSKEEFGGQFLLGLLLLLLFFLKQTIQILQNTLQIFLHLWGYKLNPIIWIVAQREWEGSYRHYVLCDWLTKTGVRETFASRSTSSPHHSLATPTSRSECAPCCHWRIYLGICWTCSQFIFISSDRRGFGTGEWILSATADVPGTLVCCNHLCCGRKKILRA